MSLEFWNLGYALFKDSPEKFPVPFIGGDAFDSSHLALVPPFTEPPSTPVPELSTLTSLTPLLGHVSACHASSLFHLFDEEDQSNLAHSLAGLLSPEPGSMIFGVHVAKDVRGYRGAIGTSAPKFCHSPESWTELWDGEIFHKGTVEVKTVLMETNPEGVWRMAWSVTRL